MQGPQGACGTGIGGSPVASLMENLIEVLCQESDEYEGLLDLSQKQTQIIASADL